MDFQDYKLLFEGQRNPEVVSLRPSKYIVVDKKVLAESSEALLAIKPLYTVSEMVKNSSKDENDYRDGEIYPLEGVWRLLNKAKGFVEHSNIIGNFMIKQPDFLTEELFNQYKDELLKSSQDADFLEYLKETNFRVYPTQRGRTSATHGRESSGKVENRSRPCVALPISTLYAIYSNFRMIDEGKNIKMLHRESYMKDIRTVEPERFETILKFQVE